MMKSGAEMNFTIGGFPESEAYQWDAVTYQRLGNIVRLALSALPDKRREGYLQYYELRRYFMENTFECLIDDLDEYRARIGYRAFRLIVEDIGKEIVKKGTVETAQPEQVQMPPLHELVTRFKEDLTKPAESCEQLSLF